MKAVAIALLLAMMAFGTFAMFKVCTDTQCQSCTTLDFGPGTCIAQQGEAIKYNCESSGDVTVSAYQNTGCSGSGIGTINIGKPGTCFNAKDGTWFLATCAASWATVVAAVAAAIAAMVM